MWIFYTENQLSFSGKMRIFYTENKQTGQLIFLFLVTLTKKQKMKNELNRTKVHENNNAIAERVKPNFIVRRFPSLK